jgi:HK97 family phage portal protein
LGLFDWGKKGKKRAYGAEYTWIPFADGVSGAFQGVNATAFICEKLIADAISEIPLNLYVKKKDGSRAKAGYHPLYSIAKYAPNSDEPPVLFYSSMVRDYFRGNVYINKVMRGKDVSSLFLLDRNLMNVKRILGRKVYTYQGAEIPSDQVLHIPSKWSYDGIKGGSIFDVLISVLKAGSSLDEYTHKSFGGVVGKRLVLELQKLDKTLTDTEIQAKQDIFAAKYGGAKNADKALMQFPDTKYSVLDTGTIDDRIRWLKENAAYQDERIAKVFGVPIPLINGTYQNNLEAIFTVFIETGLRPICTHFEQSFNMLLSPADRLYHYFEYDYNSLMKADLAARIDAYTKQITNAIASPNEVREKENLPGIGPAGDTYFIPANLMPLTMENITAYMAKNKEAQAGLGNQP